MDLGGGWKASSQWLVWFGFSCCCASIYQLRSSLSIERIRIWFLSDINERFVATAVAMTKNGMWRKSVDLLRRGRHQFSLRSLDRRFWGKEGTAGEWRWQSLLNFYSRRLDEWSCLMFPMAFGLSRCDKIAAKIVYHDHSPILLHHCEIKRKLESFLVMVKLSIMQLHLSVIYSLTSLWLFSFIIVDSYYFYLFQAGCLLRLWEGNCGLAL